MKAFNDVLHDCYLTDISITGPSLTWMRGNGVGKVMKHLDRGVVNSVF